MPNTISHLLHRAGYFRRRCEAERTRGTDPLRLLRLTSILLELERRLHQSLSGADGLKTQAIRVRPMRLEFSTARRFV